MQKIVHLNFIFIVFLLSTSITYAECKLGARTVQEGDTITAYKYVAIESPSSCAAYSQVRTCQNGQLTSPTPAAPYANTQCTNIVGINNADSARIAVHHRAWDATFDTKLSYLFGAPSSDWGGVIAWNASYLMEDMLDIYEGNQNPKYTLDAFVQYADAVFARRESVLGQTVGACRYSDVPQGAPIWTSYVTVPRSSFIKPNCWATSIVYSARAMAPVARFIELVHSRPELANDPLFSAKAGEYLSYINETLAYHEFGGATGQIRIYTYHGDGNEYAYPRDCIGCNETETELRRAGLMSPTNVIASLGSVYTHLAFLDQRYERYATALARTVNNLIIKSTHGPFTWAYWPAYDQAKADDVTHAGLVVDFVAQAKKRGFIFSAQDVNGIANNFLTRVVYTDSNQKKHLHTRIDGTDTTAGNQDISCGMWMSLSNDVPQIAETCRSICAWNSSVTRCENAEHPYLRTEAQMTRLGL